MNMINKNRILYKQLLVLVFSITVLLIISLTPTIDTSWAEEKGSTLSTWQSAYPEIVRSMVIDTGQVSLQANIHHPGIIISGDFVVPEDVWVVGFKPEVVSAPNYVLHHGNFINLSSKRIFCADMNYPFFAMGKELTQGSLPLGYGYPLSKGDKIFYTVMYHNPDSKEYIPTTKLTVFYISRSDVTLKEAEPLFIDINGSCKFGDFTIKAGETYIDKSKEGYEVKYPGKIVLAGAHMHDFADNVSLWLNDRLIKKYIPEKSGEENILSIPVSYPKDFTIKPGDIFKISTEYNNISRGDVDGMAQVLMYITPLE
jgi:hypothetical protein